MTDIETSLVPEADFDSPKTQSVIAQRTEVKIAPKYGGEFNPGDIIRLEIPSQNWLDAEMTAVSFQLKLFNGPEALATTAPTATDQVSKYWNEAVNWPRTNAFLRVGNCVQQIFNRFKLLNASNVVEDIQEYGKLNYLLTMATAPKPWIETTGLILEGIFDPLNHYHLRAVRGFGSAIPAERNRAESKGHQYYVHLNSGLLARAGKYLMTKVLGTLTIELYLETPKVCLVSSAGVSATTFGQNVTATAPTYPNGTYQVSNVYLHCHFLVPIDSYDRAILEKIEEGDGIEIHYDTYSEHTRQISLDGNGVTVNLQFQERAVSVKGAIAGMINNEDLADIRTDLVFTDNQIEQFQWRLGAQYIPSQQVQCYNGAPEAWAQLQQALGSWGDALASGSITYSNFSPLAPSAGSDIALSDSAETFIGNSRPYLFVFGLNLEKTPGQLSGFNTSATNTDIEINIKLGGIRPTRYAQISKANSAVGHDIIGGAAAHVDATTVPDVRTLHRMNAIMVEKETASTYARMFFYAHVDQVFKVQGIGSIQILK